MNSQIPIRRVLILGAGWVGRQVAARLAQYDVQVFLSDRDAETVAQARQWMCDLPPVSDSQTGCVANSWLDNVHAVPPLSKLLDQEREQELNPDVDLVLECVPEQISIKKRVLRQVSSLYSPPVLIASNSSYFMPSLLSDFVEWPGRFAHMHFHVPVLEDSVVDIVGGEETEAGVLDRLRELAEHIQQEPLMLRNEHPGYVFNWLLQALLKAALELVALDVASREDIDKAWRAAAGMPLGPFQFMDRIGLDVIEQVLSNARWTEPPQLDPDKLLKLLSEYTRHGNLGVKTGRGFYRYDAPETESPTSTSNGED